MNALRKWVSRKWIRTTHLWLSLLVGVVVLCVALSGAALVFRNELKQIGVTYDWDGKTDIGWEAARELARAFRPDHELQILWFPNESRPYYEAAYKKGEEEFTAYTRFHPATGAPMEVTQGGLLDWIEGFHVSLHLGAFGTWLVEWCTVLFTVILLSGLYLWWPGWNPRLWFAVRKRGQLYLYDLHRVLGVLSLPALLIMSVTGLVWSFPETASKAVHLLTFNWDAVKNPEPEAWQAKSKVPAGDMPERVADSALIEKALKWAPTDAFVFYITYPVRSDETVQVRLQQGYNPMPYGKVYRVYFDQYSGEIVGTERPDGSMADSFLNHWNSVLHFGTFGGVFSMILWLVFCLLVPFFAVTGVMLWRRRVARSKASAQQRVSSVKVKREEVQEIACSNNRQGRDTEEKGD